jgi:hypothetical protein
MAEFKEVALTELPADDNKVLGVEEVALPEVALPEVVLPEAVRENYSLSCFEMWLDGIKATKAALDPVSDGVGCILGTVCCIAVAAANDEDNRNRRATRHDVIHRDRIRRNQAAEANCGFAMGLCVGDALVDTLSITGGIFAGGCRATLFSCTGNNASQNTVFGYSREDIDSVELFDSCLKPMCCD